MTTALVLRALREPERVARSRLDAAPEARIRREDVAEFAALAATASLGVGLYGAALHGFGGALSMLDHGVRAVVAAGIAWTATLPSLYILGSLTGSRLPAHAITRSSLITVSFGGLAMLASIPVLWFFEFISPTPWMRLAVVLVTFCGVGLSMSDVFLRVIGAQEKVRLLHLLWLALLSVVGAEMFYVLGFFELGW